LAGIAVEVSTDAEDSSSDEHPASEGTAGAGAAAAHGATNTAADEDGDLAPVTNAEAGHAGTATDRDVLVPVIGAETGGDLAPGGDAEAGHAGAATDEDVLVPVVGLQAGETTSKRRRRPWRCDWVMVTAIGLGVLPVLVAGFRGALRGWTPTGDNAYSAVRAWDVFTPHAPLLGTWSSASAFTGHQINHPGPLHFDLLAVPVRLLGHGAGTAVGLAVVNALAVALLGWLVARRLGTAAGTLAMAASALLSWSMGSEMLYDPWSQHAPLIPFSLFLVAVWCVVAGDLVALPVLVVAGNYVIQTHLSYTLLMPGMTIFALVGLAVGYVHQRRHDPEAWKAGRGSLVRWLLIATATQVVVSSQPIFEQLTADGEGNITALIRSRSAEAPTPSLGAALRALGGTVAVPPAWLPPSFGSPSFRLDGSGRPTWLAAAGLVALVVLMAVLAWRALHRGSRPVFAGLITSELALALSLVTVVNAPVRWGMAPTYLRWMWPLGMVVWLTVAVALLDEITSRRRRSAPAPAPAPAGDEPGTNTDLTEDGIGTDASDDAAAPSAGHDEAADGAATPDPAAGRRSPRWAAAPGLALACVAAVAALPTVDNGSASPPWTVDAIHDIDDDVAAVVDGEPGVLVDLGSHVSVGASAPALFGVLQDEGVPFLVSDPNLVRQLGDDRAYEPGDATIRLSVRAGVADEPQPSERLIAESHPLTADEQDELDRLTTQVRDLIADNGLPLIEDAPAVFADLGQPRARAEIEALAGDPDAALASGRVRELWSGATTLWSNGPLLDPDVFPADLMDRWTDLDAQSRDQVIKVYVSDLPPA
jgi:hypothetical protein